MSTKSDPEKQQKVKLEIPHHGFPINVHFNRFAIVPAGDIYILQFAFIIVGRVQNVVTVSMCSEDVRRNRERLMGYLGQITSQSEMAESFSFYPTDDVISEVKTINAARGGNTAELSLYTFSMHGAMEWIREKKSTPLAVEPVARLSCETSVQVKFLLDLFATVKE